MWISRTPGARVGGGWPLCADRRDALRDGTASDTAFDLTPGSASGSDDLARREETVAIAETRGGTHARTRNTRAAIGEAHCTRLKSLFEKPTAVHFAPQGRA